jgi:hypothetical protein
MEDFCFDSASPGFVPVSRSFDSGSHDFALVFAQLPVTAYPMLHLQASAERLLVGRPSRRPRAERLFAARSSPYNIRKFVRFIDAVRGA